MATKGHMLGARAVAVALLLLLAWRSFLLPGPSALSVTAVLALFALAWASPASGVLAFSGLAPLSTVTSQLLGWSGDASGFLEQLVLAVTTGVSLRLLRNDARSRLAAPAFLLAGIATASALALLPTQMATLAVWPDRLWLVIDAWVNGRAVSTPRFFLPLQYAVVTIECAFLAWSAERVVRTQPALTVRILLMGLIAHAAAGLLNLQRVVGAAMRTGDFMATLPARLLDSRVSMQTDFNAAGSLLVLAGVAGLGALGPSTRSRIGVLLLELCVVTGLWVTGSRIAMLCAVGGCVLGAAWMASRLGGWPRRLVAIGGVSLLLAVTLLTITTRTVRHDTVEGSLRGRLALAGAGWQMFETAPFFGVGVTRFYERSAEFVGADMQRLTGQPLENAHNNFVQVLAEQGAVGLLAVGAVLALLLLGATRAERTGPSATRLWLATGLVASMGTWLTGHPLLVAEFALVFWFYAGVLAGTLPGPRSGRTAAGVTAAVLVLAATLPARSAAERDRAYLEHFALELSQWQHDDSQRYREGGTHFVLFLPGTNQPVKVPLRRAPGTPDPLSVVLVLRGSDVTRLVLRGDAWHDMIVTLPDQGRLFEEVDVRVEAESNGTSRPAVLVRVGKDGPP